MTCRCAVSITFALLLCGCGDSPDLASPVAKPGPETSVAKPDPTSLAIIEYNKGNDFLDKEDWDTAIACYSDAILLNPDYGKAYNNRGIAYRKKGETDAAIKDYTEASRLQPDDADAYRNRGAAYRMKGDKAKANADFAKADELLEAKK